MIQTKLRQLLIDDEAVTAIAGGRVYFNSSPQDVQQPMVVITTVSRVPDYTLEGPGGVDTYRLQLDCFAGTYREAKTLADAVCEAVEQYSDDENEIQWFEIEDCRDVPGDPMEGQPNPIFGVSIDTRALVFR
jgi:hypothetical protein